MTGGCFLLALIVMLLHGVFGGEVNSVKVGDSFTMNLDIAKQQNQRILWYFEDRLIALVNEDPETCCLYEGEGGRFKNGLKVDYQTGSLTITNFTPEHIGRYEAQIIRRQSRRPTEGLNGNCIGTQTIPKNMMLGEIIQTFDLTVRGPGLKKSIDPFLYKESDRNLPPSSSVLHLAPSAAVFAGICAAFLLVVL